MLKLNYKLSEKLLITKTDKLLCSHLVAILASACRHIVGLSGLVWWLTTTGFLPGWVLPIACIIFVVAIPLYAFISLTKLRFIDNANQYVDIIQGNEEFLSQLVQQISWLLPNRTRHCLQSMIDKSQHYSLLEHELMIIAHTLYAAKQPLIDQVRQRGKSLVEMARKIQHTQPKKLALVKP